MHPLHLYTTRGRHRTQSRIKRTSVFGHTLHSISLVLQIKECRSVTVFIFQSLEQSLHYRLFSALTNVDCTLKKIVEKQTKYVERNSLKIFVSFLLSLL